MENKEGFLRRRGKYWIAKLKLGHWEKIHITFSSPKEMGKDCIGNCTWWSEYKQALVQVLDPSNTLAYSGHGDDIEKTLDETLVHELLHLRLEGEREKPLAYSGSYEWALNVLAELIVNLDRKTTKKKDSGKKTTNVRRSSPAKTATVEGTNRSRVPSKRNPRVQKHGMGCPRTNSRPVPKVPKPKKH